MKPQMWTIAVTTAAAISAAGCSETPPPKPAVEVVEIAAAPATDVAATGIGPLLQALSAAQDEDARVVAVDAIAALGQRALPAYDALVKASADPAARVRWHAARAIGLIGEDAIAALPLLARLLDDPDPIVATQAAAAIGSIRADDDLGEGTPAADVAAYDAAAAALVGKMTHPDPRVRRAVLRALTRLQPAPGRFAPLVSELLADADPSVVLPALHSLADMGPEAVPFLVKALENPRTRYWASVAIAEIGPAAADAVPLLATGASAGGTEERMQSIMALAAIGEPSLTAVSEILKALDAPEASLRFAAAFALGKLRAKAADAALAKAAGDSDPLLSSIASWARARINPADSGLVDAAVGKLSAGLSSTQPGVQAAAISALSDLCDDIDDATEKRLAGDFVRLLSSPEQDVRDAAAAALVREGPLAVDALEQALTNAEIRGLAMEILTAIGPVSRDALDSFVTALSDPDPRHRGDAAVAIAAVGPAAADAVPELLKILADADAPPGLRYAAAYALGRIGPAAKPAAAALEALTSSPDELMATVATWASLKIDPANTSLFESAVPLLRKALRGGKDLARLEAAVALGDIGPAAAGAVPLLELVSEEDPLPTVRAAAKRAIGQIRAGERPAGK